MEDTEFQALYALKMRECEEVLARYLPEAKGEQKTLLEAMNYSLLAGGKRLRPILMRETFRMLGGRGRVIEPFMAAMEMIHTYSLVHDDLPAMDNDEMRRGKHTTWYVYGDAMGILAGDGLLNYAFETAMKGFDFAEKKEDEPAQAKVYRYRAVADALRTLAEKAGIYGMIGGQALDVESEKKQSPLSESQLIFVHKHKTAALIEGSMMVGAILAGGSEKTVERIAECAEKIGIAFQIQDDILDVEGDSAELGKNTGSDEKDHKSTYVTIHGMEKAKADVEQLSREARQILSQIRGDHEFLEQLVLWLIDRRF